MRSKMTAGVASPWPGFIARCLKERVRAEKFQALAKLLQERSPIRGESLCVALFTHLRPADAGLDPLIPLYTEHILAQDFANSNDVLFALLSQYQPRQTAEMIETGHVNGLQGQQGIPPQALETVFNLISRLYVRGERPRSTAEVETTLKTLASWINVLVQLHAEAMMQAVSTNFSPITAETLITREALGTLGIALLESAKATATVNTILARNDEQSKMLVTALSSFIPILGETSIHIANRLGLFLKTHAAIQTQKRGGFEANSAEALDVGQLQVSNIVDGPLMRSRANLFIYLDAIVSKSRPVKTRYDADEIKLAGRPMFNDHMVMNYLQARYKGDNQSLIADLVVAAFDLISISVHRGDSQDRLFLPKCFLVNKLPPFIASIAASAMTYVPINLEFLLSQALSRIDRSIFPSFSQGFGMGISSGALADVRQDFVFACALHGLIPAESIERILEEPPMQTLPQGGRFVKENLIVQCNENPQTVEQLINGLESMDGNVGAIAEALAIVMSNYCSSTDTKSLRNMCNHLAGRPLALDAILLFVDSMRLLAPLCRFLDDWKFEDEHGGHQPTYDDFGACFLLLTALVDRYNLTLPEVGDHNRTGFVAWLVKGRGASRPVEKFSEDQEKQLSGWIRALFETEAISDELTSTCSPHDFYKMTPAIFSQTVLACQRGVLPIDKLRNGLDLLLESFLLPCLIVAFAWTATRLWERQDDVDVILQILQRLIRPNSVHGSAFSMHGTILSVSGRRLRRALVDIQRSSQRRVDTSKQDIDPLLAKLKPDMDIQRSAESSAEELAQWDGGQVQTSTLLGLRNNIASLTVWSSPARIDMSIPSHSHRQYIAAVRIAGSRTVLNAIVSAINYQQEQGLGDLALDVATALICSPLPDAFANTALSNASNSPPSVRDCLQVEVEEAPRTILKDPQRAEILLRLHRRVESQLSMLPMPDINQLSLNIPDVMGTIGLEQSEELPMVQPDNSLPFVNSDDQLQLDISAALAAQDDDANALDSILPSAEENIFDGLQLDDDVDFA